jgi:uncharacterized protein YbgA (DUF1722 family)/uncharacterized protein YbbK (DUF523 family)
MKPQSDYTKIPIGVSSCLLGEKVRYDGGHKRNAFVESILRDYFDFKPFCPEVSIGLGIPRPTLRLEKNGERIECVETKNSEINVTDKLRECAQDQKDWQEGLSGYIFKRASPSCGMERVKVFENGHPSNTGIGIYAEQVMKNFPNLPVEEEGRLEDAVIRENFINRVIVYHRWLDFVSQKPTKAGLTEFHARHKLIYMSHDQNLARSLGADLALVNSKEVSGFLPQYLSRLTQIMKIKATKRNHVNVLQHIQGYLKSFLTAEDKAELSEAIEDYRLGGLPLIVPITLLRHHFRNHPSEYIERSYYMSPHAKELMLLNKI